MRASLLTICVCFAAAITTGCLNVRAPEKIEIGNRPRSANVDSSTIPQTRTHEQAKAELAKAYQQIRYLEYEHNRCKGKLKDAREDAEEYEEKYDRLEDEYDRLEDKYEDLDEKYDD